MTTNPALLARIQGILDLTRVKNRTAAAVLAEIETTHVLVERGRWERVKDDYVAAVRVACEKDLYLRKPGASVRQSDIDRWEVHAEARWAALVGDVDPIRHDAAEADTAVRPDATGCDDSMPHNVSECRTSETP